MAVADVPRGPPTPAPHATAGELRQRPQSTSSAAPASSPSATDAPAGQQPTAAPAAEEAQPAEAAPAATRWTEPYFPFLADESPLASVSVGDTSGGRLINGRALEETPACGVLPAHRQRELLHFGTSEMIGALEFAAARLYAATKTRLWVGNISQRGGGDIPYSVSHSSGRDADLAFCYQNAAGQPVDPTDLVPLNSAGLALDGKLRFDAARTWIVVQALLEYPGAQVQHLFISNALKQLLLTHAQTLRLPEAELLQRAGLVLNQPGGAAPHDDHLHVRLYCSQRDVEGGCLNRGVVHPWAASHADARSSRLRLARRALSDPGAGWRSRAIDRLVLLSGAEHLPAMAVLLADPAADVRATAASAVGRLGDAASHGPLLAERYRQEGSFVAKAAILRALGDLGGPAAGEILAAAIGPPVADLTGLLPALGELDSSVNGPSLLALLPLLPATVSESSGLLDGASRLVTLDQEALVEHVQQAGTLQLMAIHEAGRAERLETVASLTAMLTDHDPLRRVLAAQSLRIVTNHSFDGRWADPSFSEAQRRHLLWLWRALESRRHGQSRQAWLIAGFQSAGYDVPQLHRQHIWELVRAIAGASHVSHNAQRSLMKLTEHDPPSLDLSRRDACLYWLRWFNARRHWFDLDKPPDKTVRACYRSPD